MLRLSKYVAQSQANKFTNLLRQSSIFNCPPIQENDHEVTVAGTIAHTTPTHFMVEYGGKFQIFCEYNKKVNSEVERTLDYFKGREVIVSLDKHEDTEEFLGEYNHPSKYRAKGKFIEFYDKFMFELENWEVVLKKSYATLNSKAKSSEKVF